MLRGESFIGDGLHLHLHISWRLAWKWAAESEFDFKAKGYNRRHVLGWQALRPALDMSFAYPVIPPSTLYLFASLSFVAVSSALSITLLHDDTSSVTETVFIPNAALCKRYTLRKAIRKTPSCSPPQTFPNTHTVTS